jgi:hypothetical protein
MEGLWVWELDGCVKPEPRWRIAALEVEEAPATPRAGMSAASGEVADSASGSGASSGDRLRSWRVETEGTLALAARFIEKEEMEVGGEEER